MSLHEQFSTIIAMTVMGVWIGISLTTYHRFVHPKKKWRWMMIITDTLFWAFQGLFVFFVLLKVNEGLIRFYIFIALAIGYCAYKALFQSIYESILEWLTNVVVKTALMIYLTIKMLIVQPVWILLKLLYRSCKILISVLLSAVLFIVSVIVFPFKWAVRLLVPQSFIDRLVRFFYIAIRFFDRFTKKFR
ncbi:spore cortex biosynthesis protein YabQ [Scopulibacillus daqui]|uniref:Spore cortex biosynthesis protein YabQ n=1 Tax=Scopulibacillus daqui TaxID=1469162 RepID=A0ABS2Q2D4_9BACL|nr:spore cortex biosynthesis protein YabQ [Scopulibacillus daqui]MBM7646453.1 spore cortex biosynthesis protein YabQ [Scopulibacillus daqui]